MSRKVSQKELLEFDAWAFCRAAEALSGPDVTWHFNRLAEEPTVLNHRLANWAIRGSKDSWGEYLLEFEGLLHVEQSCVACGRAVPLTIDFGRKLLLKPNEVAVDEMNQEDLDEDIDVVACPETINLIDWFEDELLLSLPMFPRHEVCENTPELELIESFKSELDPEEEPETRVEKVKPFANLADLIKAKNK